MRNGELEERLAKAHRRTGEWMDALMEGHGARSLPGGQVTSWRVRMPTTEDPSTLLIVKVSAETGRWISFVGAPSVRAALLAWRAREMAGGMRWRSDVPWEER